MIRVEHTAHRAAGAFPDCREHPHPIPREQDTVPVRACLGEGWLNTKEVPSWFFWFIALMLISVGFFFLSPLMLGLKSKS